MKVEDLLGRPHREDHKTTIVAADLVGRLTKTYEDRLTLELAVLRGGSEKELRDCCNLDCVLDDALDTVFEDRWAVVSDKTEAAKVLERIRGRATQAARSFAYALYSPE